ncbi:MAG: hypothetical protein ABEJ74_06915 [Haloferacaceae archaeon]
MRRRTVLRSVGGAFAAAGTGGLAGCMAIADDRPVEDAPEVSAIHFRNLHDEPHEVGVRFVADSETLYAHTESLPASVDDDVPSASVTPDVPEANWTLHASLAGSEEERSIWQARIEYPIAEVL